MEFEIKTNLSFAHPKKHICTACAKLIAGRNSAKLRNDAARVRSLEISKELHLRPIIFSPP